MKLIVRNYMRLVLVALTTSVLAGLAAGSTITASFDSISGREVKYTVTGGSLGNNTNAGLFTLSRLDVGADTMPDSFPLDPLAPGADLYSFCIELGQTIRIGSSYEYTWEVQELEDARTPASTLSNAKADDLRTLIALADPFRASFVNANFVYAAIQMAVWEIVYETTEATYGLSSGNAKFAYRYSNEKNAGALSLVNGWLGQINDGASSSVGEVFAMYNREKQDQLIQVITPGNEEQVPEPATLGLTGLGLLGFALWRRRRA